MGFLLAIIVVLIFAAIWYLPLVKKQQRLSGMVTKKDLRKAFLLGLIPATIVILIAEIALGWILKFAGLSDGTLLYNILMSFFVYGAIEEIVKYECARICLKSKAGLKRIDIMVLFAAVGIGYEVTESIFFGNVIASVLRGVFVAHMMYQLVMAHFYCESLKAKAAGNKKKAGNRMALAFLIPILVHGLNDFGCHMMSYQGSSMDSDMQTLICLAGVFVLQLVLAIVGIRLANKEPEYDFEAERENRRRRRKGY